MYSHSAVFRLAGSRGGGACGGAEEMMSGGNGGGGACGGVNEMLSPWRFFSASSTSLLFFAYGIRTGLSILFFSEHWYV